MNEWTTAITDLFFPIVLVKPIFRLFRFRRLLLDRLLGRVHDSLTKSKKDNNFATRALIKQPFKWCVWWKIFVWLTHSSHMIDCIDCMYYRLYLLCSLCSYLITFQGVTSLWAKWNTNLKQSYCTMESIETKMEVTFLAGNKWKSFLSFTGSTFSLYWRLA